MHLGDPVVLPRGVGCGKDRAVPVEGVADDAADSVRGTVMSPRTAVRTAVRTAASQDLAVAVLVVVWIPSVLLLDVHAGVWRQRLLGVFTWFVLVLLLRPESSTTRVQVAVVVAFATMIEYVFSPVLGVYTYRLHNVPLFVPPGHGLIYLGALVLGRSRLFEAAGGALVAGTVAVGGVYSFWGLLLSGRPDALGAFWFGCLVLFLWRGRQPLVYVGAFLIVTYLELLGTTLGTWVWSRHDPTGLVSIGNPPSGAAGGYGFFDAAALAAAPAVMAVIGRRRAGGIRAANAEGRLKITLSGTALPVRRASRPPG